MIELSLHVKTSKEKFSLFFAVCESCTCFPLGCHFYVPQPPPPLTLPPPPPHHPKHPPTLYLSCSFLTFFVADTLSDFSFFFSFFLNIISFFFYFGVCPLVYRSCIIPKPQNPSFFCTYICFFFSLSFSLLFFFSFFVLFFFSFLFSQSILVTLLDFWGNHPRLDRFFPAAGAGACLFRQDTDWLVFGKRSSLKERNNN